MHLNTCTFFLFCFVFATIVPLSLSYINVGICIVTKVETGHIGQFLQIFYRVILALSCNKRNPPPSLLSPHRESREISRSCKNLFLNRCKINMFKLKLQSP